MAAGFFDHLRGLLGWHSAPPAEPAVGVVTRRFRGLARADTLLAGTTRDATRHGGACRDDTLNRGRIGSATMSIRQNYACNRGEAVVIDFDSTTGTDHSGDTLVCRVRSEGYAGTVLVTRSVGSGITLPLAAGTRVRVTLTGGTSGNTDRAPGEYYYTLSKTDSGEEAVLAHGLLTIEPPRVMA